MRKNAESDLHFRTDGVINFLTSFRVYLKIIQHKS
jgi:hypothetical protein